MSTKRQSIKPWHMWLDVLSGKMYELVQTTPGDREVLHKVLVIHLSRASVEALERKIAQVSADNFWGNNFACVGHVDRERAKAALSAIGIKPARVAKTKKAK